MTVTWYTLLKFVHVLLAITAVGSNITYGVWNALAAREPAHAPFALKGIAFIDRRVADPPHRLLLITRVAPLAIRGPRHGWEPPALVPLFPPVPVADWFFFLRFPRADQRV